MLAANERPEVPTAIRIDLGRRYQRRRDRFRVNLTKAAGL